MKYLKSQTSDMVPKKDMMILLEQIRFPFHQKYLAARRIREQSGLSHHLYSFWIRVQQLFCLNLLATLTSKRKCTIHMSPGA